MTTLAPSGTRIRALRTIFSLLAVTLTFATACSETVDEGATGTSSSTSGAGGDGTGGSGSGGGIAECQTVPPFAGQFGWTYTSPDGAYHDCSPDTEGATVDVVGAIAVGTSGGTYVIDTCPPNANCIPELHTITVSTDVTIEPPPVGTFVHLVASIEHLSGPPPINCGQELVITNAPTFGGLTSPTASDTLPWLDPIDTNDGVFAAAYAPVCSVDHPDPGCSWTETFYSVKVAYSPALDAATDALMGGETGTLTVAVEGGENVSFAAHYALMSNGNCENPGASAVWVQRKPM